MKHNEKKRLSSNLRRRVDGSFTVVDSVDHPLVLRSVDILSGGSAGLTAIMVMSAAEVRQPKLFYARLALNRLALPPHTRFVFVGTDEKEFVGGSWEGFSATLSLEESSTEREIARIVESPQRLSQIKYSEKLDNLYQRRFGESYRLARILQHRALRKGESFLDTHSDMHRTSRKPLRDLLSENVEAAFFAAPPNTSAVANLTLKEADRWFDLPSGELWTTEESAGVAFAETFPKARSDPDKVMRCAAFAGWVLAPAHGYNSPEEIAKLIEKYTRL